MIVSVCLLKVQFAQYSMSFFFWVLESTILLATSAVCRFCHPFSKNEEKRMMWKKEGWVPEMFYDFYLDYSLQPLKV